MEDEVDMRCLHFGSCLTGKIESENNEREEKEKGERSEKRWERGERSEKGEKVRWERGEWEREERGERKEGRDRQTDWKRERREERREQRAYMRQKDYVCSTHGRDKRRFHCEQVVLVCEDPGLEYIIATAGERLLELQLIPLLVHIDKDRSDHLEIQVCDCLDEQLSRKGEKHHQDRTLSALVREDKRKRSAHISSIDLCEKAEDMRHRCQPMRRQSCELM
jgi:hypothetical protein